MMWLSGHQVTDSPRRHQRGVARRIRVHSGDIPIPVGDRPLETRSMSQHLQTTTALQRVSWPFVAVLAVAALVRPLLSVTGLADDWGRPATPLLATVFVTIV